VSAGNPSAPGWVAAVITGALLGSGGGSVALGPQAKVPKSGKLATITRDNRERRNMNSSTIPV
jgi:hypothetical protein